MANNDDKKTDFQNKLSYDKAIAYMANRFGGKSAKRIAETMGRGERTISRYIKDFDDYVKGSDEYNNAIRDIVKMIPDSVKVYQDALQSRGNQGNPDVACARDIFKMVALYKERAQIETSDQNNSDTDLFSELWGLIGASTNTEIDSAGESQSESDNTGAETPED